MKASPVSHRRYLEEQLAYDHLDDIQPANTRAVIQNQHTLIRQAVERESHRHPVHLLDVGCGWGDLWVQLRDLLRDYVGVEPSLRELQRIIPIPSACFVRGIGEHLDFLRSSSRTVILLNSVLDHCIDWQRTFRNCMRILSPGGIMIISMENADKIPVSLRRVLRLPVEHEGHMSFFSMRELVRFLQSEQLSVERAQSIGFLYGFHQLTKYVPFPQGGLRILNHAVDRVAASLVPHAGHVMFLVARKSQSGSPGHDLSHPFQCVACRSAIVFGTEGCPQCGRSFTYVGDTILDTTVDREFVAFTGTTGST